MNSYMGLLGTSVSTLLGSRLQALSGLGAALSTDSVRKLKDMGAVNEGGTSVLDVVRMVVRFTSQCGIVDLAMPLLQTQLPHEAFPISLPICVTSH